MSIYKFNLYDKTVVARKGIYEIQNTNPLEGFNGHTKFYEPLYLNDCIKITNDQYEKLQSMSQEEVLKKISDEYPELHI